MVGGRDIVLDADPSKAHPLLCCCKVDQVGKTLPQRRIMKDRGHHVEARFNRHDHPGFQIEIEAEAAVEALPEVDEEWDPFEDE